MIGLICQVCKHPVVSATVEGGVEGMKVHYHHAHPTEELVAVHPLLVEEGK